MGDKRKANAERRMQNAECKGGYSLAVWNRVTSFGVIRTATYEEASTLTQ